MNFGVLGVGSENGWQVDILVMEGRDLYGVTIRGGRCLLQVGDLAFHRLKQLQQFLEVDPEEESIFLLHGAFGGKLELVQHEEQMSLRVSRDPGDTYPNLLEVTLSPE